MKSLRRFMLPLFVLVALALSVAGVAFAREVTGSSLFGVLDQKVEFSGVVQADTVISNSVISAAYTPGAGNIW